MSDLDTSIMDQIHAVLDGKEWESDTIEEVAMLIEASGRLIRGPEVTYQEPKGDGQLYD